MTLQNRIKYRIFFIPFLLICFIFFSFKPSDLSKENTIFQNSLVVALTNQISDGDLPDWALLDPDKDGYEGTRTKTFYQYLQTLDFVPERKEVIVAVIDSGFDIDHPDLKDNVWKNEKELQGTKGIDDDKNGYTDDFYGWNFLGNVKYLPLEVTREYVRLRKENIPETDPYFQKVKNDHENKEEEILSTQRGIQQTLEDIEDAEKILKEKNIPTDPKILQGISNELESKYQDAASFILGVYLLYGAEKKDMVELKEQYDIQAKLFSDTSDAQVLVGDNPNLLLETGYGNNDVTELKEVHGTHVAGIIGSKKTGQAPFVKIMFLRAVPNEGDERDKDIGNAIRYAVDNGANIINMSAGKYYSLNPEFVVDAIKYAESKGVLFVVSAGNEGEDASKRITFPRKFLDENGEKKYFSNMLVVGANSWMKQWNQEKDPLNHNAKFDLAAPFSNYSNNVVDIFAPGVEINSTVPNGKYKMIDGTSMAAPQVAGIAAVLKAYYPQISASQIKEAIISSARKYDGLMVKIKGKSKELFSNLSRSGGVIDLMNAYLKAGELVGLQN